MPLISGHKTHISVIKIYLHTLMSPNDSVKIKEACFMPIWHNNIYQKFLIDTLMLWTLSTSLGAYQVTFH